MPCDDCSRAENCPPCVNAPLVLKDGESLLEGLERPKACTCGPDEACGDPCTPEPPMTPEEEEEAPCPHESWEVGTQWRDGGTGKWWKTRRCADCRELLDNILDDEQHDFEGQTEPPPPQPVRRPPYAVAYSVQGHLYEVALPGDAAVKAVDGALVIQHHLGPVVSIVQVLPVINEGGAGGAEADQ